MTRWVRLVMVVLFLCCTTAEASENSRRLAAERMLRAVNVEKMFDTIYAQVENMMQNQITQTNVPEDAKPIISKYTKRTLELMQNEMSWDTLKDDMISVYVKVYTEKELIDIAEFYESTAGKKFTEKMPELTQQTMAMVQKKMVYLQPKLEQLAHEMRAEIEQYSQNSPN